MYFGKPYTPNPSYNIEDVIQVSSATTLSFPGNRKIVMLNSPANYTVSLPLVASVELGTTIQFIHNYTQNTVTLLVAGSDVISNQGNSSTSWTIYPGDSYVLQSLNTVGSLWGIVESNSFYPQPQGTNNNYPATTSFVITEANKHTNPLINANFDIWQAGTSFALTNQTAYTADMFQYNTGTSGVATVSRAALNQATVGFTPFYGLNIAQTGAASGTPPELIYRGEGVRSFAGQTLTISFYAVATSNVTLSSCVFHQYFGTGGSPSATVDTTMITNPVIGTSRSRIVMTFTVPTITGKTIGTNGDDYFGISLYFPGASLFNVTVDGFRLDIGLTAAPLESKLGSVEFDAASRYYEVIRLFGTHAVTAFTTTTADLAPIYMKTRKRTTNPGIILNGVTGSVFNNGNSQALSSVTGVSVTEDMVNLRVGFANNSFSVTTPAYVNISTSSYIGLSSRL